MIPVIQTVASVLRIEGLDPEHGRRFNQVCIETPRAASPFTDDGVACFIALFRLVFEGILDGVGFACVFEFLNGIERIINVEGDERKVHTAPKQGTK